MNSFFNVMRKGKFVVVIFLFLVFSCSVPEKSKKSEIRKKNAKAEYILRHENCYFFPIFTPTIRERELYPWEKGVSEKLQKITKDFFRCKGSSLNVPITEKNEKGQPFIYRDCIGGGNHSLPIIHGKEGVYPVLVEILNYLQQKTGKKVIITCGYRCPLHNRYADRSKNNILSKHQLGAEVDFYVQGMEQSPLEVIDLIFQFYKDQKGYKESSDYQVFERRSVENTNVSTMPWSNKEIYIKLYKESEGRDFDNRHPYPYVSIQVRYDRDTKERVICSQDKIAARSL